MNSSIPREKDCLDSVSDGIEIAIAIAIEIGTDIWRQAPCSFAPAGLTGPAGTEEYTGSVTRMSDGDPDFDQDPSSEC